MLFHGVISGQAWLEAGARRLQLQAGDVVLLPRGSEHRLLSDPSATAVPILTLPRRLEGAVPVLEYGSPGQETRLICGLFQLEHPAAGTFIELLPTVLEATPQAPERRAWVRATLELLDMEVRQEGAQATVTSLANTLLTHVLVSARPEQANTGLLAAASDAQIARALALIHGECGQPWTVPLLAERVGMSRTRFFEKFTQLMGEPPARYIARWRALTAADLMKRKHLSIAEIATMVGYSSEDALGRVFKRYVGSSPGLYRRSLEEAAS